MKILYIGASEYLLEIKKNGYSHMYDLWMYLIQKTQSLELWTNTYINTNDILDFKPDIIWIFDCMIVSPSFTSILSFCKQLKVPIVYLGDDVFYIKDLHTCNNVKLIDAIVFLVKMDKLKSQYKTEFPDKIVKSFESPFINIEQFNSHCDNQKIYDITIYGSTDCLQSKDRFPLNNVHKEYLEKWKKRNDSDIPNELNFYEFRKRVKELVIKSNKYKLNIIEPSQKGCWDCKIRGKDLSKEINKSYLSLATRTCIDKCMQKYIEISASDTKLLCNIPTDYIDLFKNNVIEINDDMTDEEILNTIDKALENKEELINNSKIFGEKIRTNYGSDKDTTIKEFLKISEEIKYIYNINAIN